MWNPGWNRIFKENEWGKYPDTDVIRFVARNYFNVQNRRKVRLLEVGCGPGANILFFSKEGFDAVGVDGSELAIQRCQQRLADEHLTAELHISDIATLPLSKDSIDGVIDCECLYANSFKDSLHIMKEIHRVLKPGGLFFSMTFSVGSFGDGNGETLEGEPNTYTKIHDGAFHKGYGVIRLTPEKDIPELYGKYFEIISVEYVHRSMNARKNEVREWLVTTRKNN